MKQEEARIGDIVYVRGSVFLQRRPHLHPKKQTAPTGSNYKI